MKRIISSIGYVFVADFAFVVARSLVMRYTEEFTVLIFGSNFECSKRWCSDMFCSYHNVRTMLRKIDDAKYSLDIAMYMLSDDRFCARLLGAHLRGVDVRIIVDVSKGLNINLQALRKLGMAIEYLECPGSSLMHHKFCIVDGRTPKNGFVDRVLDTFLPPLRNSCVMTGSLNWTKNGLSGNYEDVSIINDPSLVRQFQEMFNSLADDIYRDGRGFTARIF